MSSGYLGPRDGGYGQAQMSNSNVGGGESLFLRDICFAVAWLVSRWERKCGSLNPTLLSSYCYPPFPQLVFPFALLPLPPSHFIGWPDPILALIVVGSKEARYCCPLHFHPPLPHLVSQLPALQVARTHNNTDSNPFTTPGSRPNSGYFPRDDADHMTPLAPATGSGAAIPMSQSSASMASRPLSGVGGSNRDSMAYQNIPSDQYWNEPTRFSTGAYAPTYNDNDDGYEGTGAGKGTSNKKKWIIGGVVLGVLAIAGIVAGVVVSQMNKKSGGSGSSSDSGSSGSGSGNGTTDLSNPSQFDKDSRLHQSFWAIAYTPEVSLYPIFLPHSRTISIHTISARNDHRDTHQYGRHSPKPGPVDLEYGQQSGPNSSPPSSLVQWSKSRLLLSNILTPPAGGSGLPADQTR
jgi:hypothetical protein